MADRKLLLIDGNSIMNRGYFALPKDLTNSRGLHTNAILGFFNILIPIWEEENPTHVIVAFDLHEPTFRHKMYAEYKGTRHAMDPELREQFPVVKDLLAAMKVQTAALKGYEADDVLGTCSRMAPEDMKVTILSGDRDMLQLATDRVLIRIPKKKGGKTVIENYDGDAVREATGVTPEEFIEMKGLMGDTSDNIPGVPGIGPKTASRIIHQFHTVENAIQHIEEVKPDKARNSLDSHREQAVFSRDLSRICLEAPVTVQLSEAAVRTEDLFSDEVLRRMQELELNSLIRRLPFESQEKTEETVQKLTWKDITDLTELPFYQDEAPVSPVGMALQQTEDTAHESDGIHLAVFSQNGQIFLWKSEENLSNRILTLIRKWNMPQETYAFSLNGIKKWIVPLGIRREDPVFDGSLAEYLLNPLQTSAVKDKKKDKKKDAEEALAEEALKAEKAGKEYPEQLKKSGEWKLYTDLEHPLTFVLSEMEQTGICCRKDLLEEFGTECKGRIQELEQGIYQAAGETFNIRSTRQLGVILFEKLELPCKKKTKSGYSTSVEVLEQIQDLHPIVPMILEYRQLTKLLSTYVEGLMAAILPDGRIHSRFHQTVTATGRISSTDPNLQNIPARTDLGREIRKAFVPRNDWVFIDADYSQIELRVMASLSGDQKLIEDFHEGKDIHAITASRVFNVPLDQVTPELRRKAKAVNFGIIYGISSFGLGQDLKISRKEAREDIDRYFNTYPDVKKYLDHLVESARETGRSVTYFHRIRPIPELKSRNFAERNFGERVAMNAPVQGTAADIMKIAMIRVADALKKQNLQAGIVLQIHDELLIEAPAEEVEEVKKILLEDMQGAVEMAVPFYIDIHTGSSLYEVK